MLRIGLISERALDTMNLAGIKARPSRGVFGPVREYLASNEKSVRLHRPMIDGKYVEITQTDLDVLRAINAKYFEDNIRFRFTRFHKDNPEPLIKRLSVLNDVTSEQAMELVADELAELVVIRYRDLRRRLRGIGSGTDISDSLNKLSKMRVTGEYFVRHGKKAIPVHIDGNFINFEQAGNGQSGGSEYYIFFASKWAQLYVHNLRAGNITWPPLDDYRRLGNLEKNILYTVLAYPKTLTRRYEDNLLEIWNVKVGKDRQRAVVQLDTALDRLAALEYLSWTKEDSLYQIRRKIRGNHRLDSQTALRIHSVSRKPSLKSTGQSVVEQSSKVDNASVQKALSPAQQSSLPAVEMPDPALDEPPANQVDEVLEAILDAAQRIEKSVVIGHRDARLMKALFLRRYWHMFSPYYLWGVDWFHAYIEGLERQTSPPEGVDAFRFSEWKRKLPAVLSTFDEIRSDPSLQSRIKTVKHLAEEECGIPLDEPFSEFDDT